MKFVSLRIPDSLLQQRDHQRCAAMLARIEQLLVQLLRRHGSEGVVVGLRLARLAFGVRVFGDRAFLLPCEPALVLLQLLLCDG